MRFSDHIHGLSKPGMLHKDGVKDPARCSIWGPFGSRLVGNRRLDSAKLSANLVVVLLRDSERLGSLDPSAQVPVLGSSPASLSQ